MNRKCKNLTLDEKLKIIKRIESQEKVGAKPNLTRIAEDYGVHGSTIKKNLMGLRQSKAYKPSVRMGTQMVFFIYGYCP